MPSLLHGDHRLHATREWRRAEVAIRPAGTPVQDTTYVSRWLIESAPASADLVEGVLAPSWETASGGTRALRTGGAGKVTPLVIWKADGAIARR